jgi:anti-sigma regulatory factor (Ser/Thr protein kinase)
VTVQTQDSPVARDEHVVHFYERDCELLEAVVPYLSAAVRDGEVAIVIATESHRSTFEAELETGGVDLAEARADGRFISLDAAETMAAFSSSGEIDRLAFHEVIGGLVRSAAASGRAVRAYGEMVALLWDAGDVLAAIELETLWNELARRSPFTLFCAYPATSVAGSEHAQALHEVCHLHSSVLDPPDVRRLPADRSRQTELTAEFPAERVAPGQARRLLVSALREWDQEESLVQDAALVLSELASNAVLHAGSRFSIAVRVESSILRIAVHDVGPVAAMSGAGALAPQATHGLGLIDALSTDWGVESTPDGKVVWAELPV